MVVYRLALSLVAPFLLVALLWRVVRGTERWGDLSQRVGGGDGLAGSIWLHGASNGELTSARPLIEALIAAYPDQSVVVTANTLTGRDLVAGWGLPRVIARLAPLDLRWVLVRFRARWRPVVLIFLENELWPNRIATAREPVLAVAARISARSALQWSRVPKFARGLVQRIVALFPQDADSADRFAALGLDRARVGPVTDLKRAVTLANPSQDALSDLKPHFPRDETILAASTHPGEEVRVLAAFRSARQANPNLKLILAPRHPARGDDVAAMIRDAGLSFARRSASDLPTAATQVYLADTLGEMPLWYALAGQSFVGGSLVAKGGHTPFEPLQAGSAIMHGPHVENFRAVYQTLDTAEAAVRVDDADGLARAMVRLADRETREAIAHRATKTVPQSRDPITPILASLKELLRTGTAQD